MAQVSIIIPTYNAGSYLDSAVSACLEQTYHDVEIIVIDDGSTDGSVENIVQLEDERIRVIRQANAGKPAAMNRALREVSSSYYCVLDADDEMHPERVARQVAALEANPDIVAVFCGHELIIGDRHMAPLLRGKSREECRRDIDCLRMPAHDPTGMYRLSMVRGIEYAPDLPIVEGLDYILRVGEQWPMIVLRECLYSYRIHESSLTHCDPEKREQMVARAIFRACKRRGFDVDQSPRGRRKRKMRKRSKDNNLPAHFMESVTDLRRIGRRSSAIRTALLCGRLNPLYLEYWKPLALGVLPEWALNALGRSM